MLLRTLLALFLTLTYALYADDWQGGSYARHSSVQQTQGEKAIDSMHLKLDDCVLDVGCGDGKLLAKIKELAPIGNIIGIDPSESMLSYAQNEFPNINFFKAKAEDFKLEERFDHIFSCCAMHWVKDQKIALDNIYTHLKPNGKFHCVVASSKEGLAFHKALKETLEVFKEDFVGYENPLYTPDLETHRKLLTQAGFHIDSIHYDYYQVDYQDQNELKNWIQQWLPEAKYLSEDKQKPFFDELMSRYQDGSHWGEYFISIKASKLD